MLIYLGARADGLCSIAEISRAYDISQNNLMKVVNDLVNAGYLASARGRFGGIKLARLAVEINVGAVVRHTEDGFDLVDCGECIIAPACGMTGALRQALAAFLNVLDGYTLADLITKPAELGMLFSAARNRDLPQTG